MNDYIHAHHIGLALVLVLIAGLIILGCAAVGLRNQAAARKAADRRTRAVPQRRPVLPAHDPVVNYSRIADEPTQGIPAYRPAPPAPSGSVRLLAARTEPETVSFPDVEDVEGDDTAAFFASLKDPEPVPSAVVYHDGPPARVIQPADDAPRSPWLLEQLEINRQWGAKNRAELGI